MAPAIEASQENKDDGSEFEPLEFAPESEYSYNSAGSAIYRHSFENGRRYHYFRNGKYPIPNDDIEQNREALKHVAMLELTNGRLVHAPIGDNPRKIIDIGTGTGIWAIEVAEKYPNAQVVGVDLSPIQPTWMPPNVEFIIDDVEEEWLTRSGNYDYVYMRHFAPFAANLGRVLRRCYENMNPGAWIETGDFNGGVDCDDGSMPDDWPLRQFWLQLAQGMRSLPGGSYDTRVAPQLGEALTAAGFVNVSVAQYKAPIGTWPADKTLRLVGLYMRQINEAFLGAAKAKPFQTLDMSEEEIEHFMARVLAALQDRSVHAWTLYYVWTAQKPPHPRNGTDRTPAGEAQ